jgi:sirohydrochlorin cobaltochelatase
MKGETMKKGIIIVSFGTTYERTRRLCIESIENRVKEEYKDFLVLRAFTSQMVINKLKQRDNYIVRNPKEALEKMKDNGIENIYIQPLHIIPGHEYEKLIRQTRVFLNENNNFNIQIGKPLLYDDLDYYRIIEGLKEDAIKDNEAIVFMGHGTDHSADEAYEKLENAFKQEGYNNIFIGTVEGRKTIDDIIVKLKEQKIKRVKLMPFMLVAGDHAINDMASESPDSWRTKLISEDIEVEVNLKGLGEIKNIQDIYMDHLKAILVAK